MTGAAPHALGLFNQAGTTGCVDILQLLPKNRYLQVAADTFVVEDRLMSLVSRSVF